MNALLQLGEAERPGAWSPIPRATTARPWRRPGQWLGVPVTVVMPRPPPRAIKRAATEGYGATVVPCEPTLEAREVDGQRPDRPSMA